jgi:hypothetical protein
VSPFAFGRLGSPLLTKTSMIVRTLSLIAFALLMLASSARGESLAANSVVTESEEDQNARIDDRGVLEAMFLSVTPFLVLGLLIWMSSAECLAQQTATPDAALSESLSEEVNDPTATLTQAQIQEFFTPSQYGTNAQPNTLQGRFVLAILPHGPLPLAQIVRPTFALVTIPRNKGASTRTEFGDSQLLDLFGCHDR